eukprot:6191201-Pleurochrysis_carterae.AAC.3
MHTREYAHAPAARAPALSPRAAPLLSRDGGRSMHHRLHVHRCFAHSLQPVRLRDQCLGRKYARAVSL